MAIFLLSFLPIPFLILVTPPITAAGATAGEVVQPSLELLPLLAIKSSLKDPLNSLRDWDPGAAFSRPGAWCSWAGIQCDRRTGRLIKLDLSARNLSGVLPNEIKFLSHLHHLNLSWNSIQGPLPTAVFDLRRLRTLDINHNYFNSTFLAPSNLDSLEFLNAYSNSFTGPLPDKLIRLVNLEYLNLGGSYFEGEVPSDYGRFPRLRYLYLQGNLLTGRIPGELGLSTQLQHVELGYNAFLGDLPAQLSNLSNLLYLDISSANLSGDLPAEFGRLTKLQTLLLFKNNLSGSIPKTWAQMESLQILDLSDNHLSGEIPGGFSSLKRLKTLFLMNNNLTGEIPEGIGEFPDLEALSLWNNSLSGILPQKLGYNGKLQKLDVSSNSLSGPIPPNLCLGSKLIKLMLFSNRLVGEIPTSLANCTTLYRLRIHDNNLNGSIPPGFGYLPNLTYIELSKNSLSGLIPKDIVDSPKLEFLNISENRFGSGLPDGIWNAPSLQVFAASGSRLTGKIPDFIGCQGFYKIELDGNKLTGNIPWDIGHCEKLISLKLSGNSLTGIIPWEISTLPSITDVDLSHNFLTGAIPSNFGNCTTLENFNVSYNQLTGPVPSSGPLFSTLHPSSFTGNDGLCGAVIRKPCRAEGFAAEPVEVRRKPQRTAGAIVWIVAAALGIGLFILIAGTRCFQAVYGGGKFSGEPTAGPWSLTSFQRLNFTAEDVLECVNLTDRIIGMGSAGTVYKAEMPGGEIIAVKKLWCKQKDMSRRRRGVLAEVDVLGKIRHRNIVRLLGCCSNNQATMLLYEYMPNGSLEDLLHGKSNLGGHDWVTRYKIALGVAQGLCYLHHDCDPVIVHRDLKPSNILLDGEMEAHVADFGVAKLFQMDESMSVIAGSYGYIAPEYAYTLQVDEKSDIYSYGVVLMEILTGKKSVEAEFGEGNNIVDWLRSKMKAKLDFAEILDQNVGSSCAFIREEMVLVLRLALLCTSRNPTDRPSMRDVVSMLHEARPKRKAASNGIGEPQKSVCAAPC